MKPLNQTNKKALHYVLFLLIMVDVKIVTNLKLVLKKNYICYYEVGTKKL